MISSISDAAATPTSTLKTRVPTSLGNLRETQGQEHRDRRDVPQLFRNYKTKEWAADPPPPT